MELLAPAGSMESVVAAVQNGANAVYLGQQRFNARRNAENFTPETLKQAVDYCHLRGVAVYQTMNILVYDRELQEVQEALRVACEAGIDALIVQDLAVIELAKRCCPQMRLHGSTQMTVHTPQGAKFCEELGLRRVVLSRELSIAEIGEIAASTPLEIEVFAHGALCMSVSGQCTMSAMIGTRSGNRGSCAGSCRLPFGVQRAEDYDLSLKDLCAIHHLQALEEAGVTSLKIEGRMKRPEYVAAATGAYAKRLAGGKPDLRSLEAVFSRSGFTDGYLTAKRDGTMFGTRQKEDVLAAKEVLDDLKRTYQKEQPRIPLSMSFTMTASLSELTVSDGEHSVSVSGDLPQQALRRPLDEASARASLEKLGGTPYRLAKFSAAIDEGLMLPKSQLNDLRRRALERLDNLRTARPVEEFHFTSIEACGVPQEKFSWMAHAETAEQLASIAEEVSMIALPMAEVERHAAALLPYADKLCIEPPRVLFGQEQAVEKSLQTLRAQGFLWLAASNPAHLLLGRAMGYRMMGTHFLNVTNRVSAAVYRSFGVEKLALSVEMTVRQVQQLGKESPMPVGAVLYGSLPVMICRNCPAKRTVGCARCRRQNRLTDRRGNRFAVLCREKQSAEVLNCQPLWMADKREEFAQLSFGVLYFTTESPAECAAIVRQVKSGAAPSGSFTRGLYYRGTAD